MKNLVEKLEKSLMVSVLGLALLAGSSIMISGTNSFALPNEENSKTMYFTGPMLGCPVPGGHCVVITVWG